MAGKVLMLAIALVVFAGCRRAPDPHAALQSLVEAERAFAHLSVTGGMRTAFLHNLASDAIIFRPHPVNGQQWFEQRGAAGPTRLAWQPAFADVAASGDFGYTTGPWWFTPDTTAGPAASFGHYVSVWKRYGDSPWRVAIDTGISHEQPEAPQTVGHPALAAAAPAAGERPPLPSLVEADRNFARLACSDGLAAALALHAHDDLRFYRPNQFPHVGKVAAEALVRSEAPLAVCEPIAGDVAGTGDLGFTYGKIERRGELEPAAGAVSYYLRIWKRDGTGAWLLVLDLESPVPPGQN